MINWLKREKVKPIYVMAGDSIVAEYDGRDGRHERITVEATKTQRVDHLAIGEFENELGFSNGIVGVFGNE